jgi:uncharacterized membrane protein
MAKPWNQDETKMIDLSIFEAVILVLVVTAAGLAVVLYTPPWAALLGLLGAVIHALVQAIDDEWTVWLAVRVIVFSVLAVVTWWRYLRGTEDRHWRGLVRRWPDEHEGSGPKTKQP